MSLSNLPPGCTSADIERRFGITCIICPVCGTGYDGDECPKCNEKEDEGDE